MGTPIKWPWGKCHSPITEHECSVALENGLHLVGESNDANPIGTCYVRFVDANGNERAYWESTEWAESPEEVMGAILGAMNTPKEDIPN